MLPQAQTPVFLVVKRYLKVCSFVWSVSEDGDVCATMHPCKTVSPFALNAARYFWEENKNKYPLIYVILREEDNDAQKQKKI